MTQENERATPAWMHTASLLAHHLHSIGWRSPNDAQWDHLHDLVWAPLASALRSPVVEQQPRAWEVRLPGSPCGWDSFEIRRAATREAADEIVAAYGSGEIVPLYALVPNNGSGENG